MYPLSWYQNNPSNPPLNRNRPDVWPGQLLLECTHDALLGAFYGFLHLLLLLLTIESPFAIGLLTT